MINDEPSTQNNKRTLECRETQLTFSQKFILHVYALALHSYAVYALHVNALAF